MRKLLSADFSRLFHSRIYWIGMIFMLGFGVFAVVARYRDTIEYPDFEYATVDGLWFVGGMYLSVVLAVFISIWVGTDYSDGTIRNKISVGHTRGAIYRSNWVACTAASIMMHLAYLLPVAALGIILLGEIKTPVKTLVIASLASILTVIALVSIFLMIAMLIHSKSTGAVVSMIVALVMLISSMTIYNMLQAPKYIENNFEMSANGEVVQGEPMLNPRYLEGVKREVYQFILDATPTGQMLQYGQALSLPPGIDYFPLYSMLLIVICCGCGGILFRRKDLK